MSGEWGTETNPLTHARSTSHFPLEMITPHLSCSALENLHPLDSSGGGKQAAQRTHTPAEDGLENSRAPPSPPRPTTLLFTEPAGSTREKDQTLLPTGQASARPAVPVLSGQCRLAMTAIHQLRGKEKMAQLFIVTLCSHVQQRPVRSLNSLCKTAPILARPVCASLSPPAPGHTHNT